MLLDIHNFSPYFSVTLNLSSHFLKKAPPCCFKIWHTMHIWKVHLNLSWLVASPNIEQQHPGTKNATAIFIYTISGAGSQKKTRTRVQLKHIELNIFKKLFLRYFLKKFRYLYCICKTMIKTCFSRATKHETCKNQVISLDNSQKMFVLHHLALSLNR